MWTLLRFWLIKKFQWDVSIHYKIRCVFTVVSYRQKNVWWLVRSGPWFFFFLLCPQLPLLKLEMSMFGHLMVRKLLRKWEFLFDKNLFFFHVKLVRNNLLYSIWRFDTFIFLLLRYSYFDCFSKNKEIILNSNQKLFWNSFDQKIFNSYRQALFVFSSVSLWWHLKKSYIRNILRKGISSTGELRASSHRCHIRHDRTTATQFCKHLPKLCFF